MEILGLFREAEQELDLHPEVRRAATGDDIMKTAGQMGLAGSLLANQFKSLAVTQEELDAFHRSSVPRHIPSGVKRQVLGDNLPLVFIGIVFFIAGIVAGGATLAFAPGNDKWIPRVQPCKRKPYKRKSRKRKPCKWKPGRQPRPWGPKQQRQPV